MKMKAMVLYAPHDYRIEMIDVPEVGKGDVLIKVEAAAICSTDGRIIEGTKKKGVHYPSTIGHEICGKIVQVGEDVKEYKVGQRLAVAPVITCGRCDTCTNDHENDCRNRVALGYEYGGGFAEYVLIPELAVKRGNIVLLPDSVSSEAGALIEPLACAIHGIYQANVKFNDVVTIVGTGPIGLMQVKLAKLFGARKVIVSEPNERRRNFALKMGADVAIDPTKENLHEVVMRETNNIGSDVVIIAINAAGLINSLLKICRKGATFCLFAGFSDTGECTIEANVIHFEEIRLVGSIASKRTDFYKAADMIINKSIDADEIATHTFSLDEFDKAYEVFKKGEGLKVVIKP